MGGAGSATGVTVAAEPANAIGRAIVPDPPASSSIPMNLDQSVALVTGAARGIGRALSEALVEAGARVVLTDADPGALAETAETLPADRIASRVLDVRDERAHAGALESTLRRFGRLDAWINNAGLARHRRIVDYTVEDLDLMMDVNLKGVVLGCREALAHFAGQGRGHIVNVVSTAALRGIPTESFYGATKWAVRGFTQSLAEEAAPSGVRVTAVLPGGVATGFWSDAVDRPMPVEDFLDPRHVADTILSVLRQPDACVTRELVVRSLRDRDFAGR